MFSVATNQIESFSNLGRRELLRIGGLTALGLSLPEALRAQQAIADGTENLAGRSTASCCGCSAAPATSTCTT
ncbi:MAG: hypothetical protein Ct9H300mP1_03360 [Planctomycetaceae bacterium]|nr:MAG: hypothetical protein Ct9H300mP1_03360 [Planctomycetaceae bacterium]